MRAYFTSDNRTYADAVSDLLADARLVDRDRPLDLRLTAFSFTDKALANTVMAFCRDRPGVGFYGLFDWGQLQHGQSVLPDMIRANRPETRFRVTLDQPYVWDHKQQRLRWSYHASLGFLHHKTLILLVDGLPHRLVCGSANWTKSARGAYENTLLLSADERAEADAIARFASEFNAIWCDGRHSLSIEEAEAHNARLRVWKPENEGATRPPRKETLRGAGEHLGPCIAVGESQDTTVSVAFSARREQGAQRFGYASLNHDRYIKVASPTGHCRKQSFSITATALAVIFAARPGDRLYLAMFGLSPRVAEYGALLDAARRGVSVYALLDLRVGGDMAARLRHQAARESLPIKVRTSDRRMHQKYILCPERSCLATGTANMSTDSSMRHAEHRMLLQGSPDMTQAFVADFLRMWNKAKSLPTKRGSKTTEEAE